GSWMQSVAQGLLVLQLTGSGTRLGFVIALQCLPVLFLGPWGGIFADRYSKRKILYVTQSASCILGLTVGVLVMTDAIRLWMVYVVGILLGFITLFDNPARSTFVRELVGNDRLTNAIALSATEMNLTRVIGPAFAGVLAATVGLGACFLVDGLSYIPVLISLYLMRESELMPAVRVAGGKGQVRAGLEYVRTSPILRNILIMMAVIGMLTYEFSVMLPLMGEFTFHKGPGAYAAMTAAMGAGAVVGGLFTASRDIGASPILVGISGLAFGAAVLSVAFAPSLKKAIVLLLIVGFFNINFTSFANVTLQLTAAPMMQGRVMALWTMAFIGTTPVGGPVMGAIGEHGGARIALAVAGLAAIGAAGWATFANRRHLASLASFPTQDLVPEAIE
ncbi:MAG TPA: MFS transporter, partial [Thermomicrobiales bacterium]|nr:MFS transporter [Thermomicrobiales bacterium]